MSFTRNIALGALIFAAIAASAAGQTANTSFIPFAKFKADLSASHMQDFARRQGAAVRDTASFEEMRHYLLNIYDGVTVGHSFALDAQVFDCVPVMQQPGVRLNGITTLDTPPPPPAMQPGVEGVERHPGLCAAGTIPMRRITLDEMTRFATLQQFLHKSEGEADPHSGRATQEHKYAFSYQYQKSNGTSTILNIWKPTINQNKTQVFALSQSWDVGGSGSTTQTAETGWQVYPSKYSSTAPTLFIYWTADDYTKTGCYNLDCAAFVQKDNSVVLGGPLTPSMKGGKQREIVLSYYFYKGNWWLWSGTYIGYYPGKLYKSGALSKHATFLEFGGEVVGTTSWPPMGSGELPSHGYKQAAYQRSVWWLNAKNDAFDTVLTLDQEAPNCYLIATTPAPGKSSWSKYPYFYFGGPGGKNC
jgi:hypothetical protein